MNPFLQSVLSFMNIDESKVEEPSPDMGDFAVPCFRFAKEQKKSPAEIAEDYARSFTPGENLLRAEAKGPYVNFFVNREKYSEFVLGQINDSYGHCEAQKDRVMIEYCQVNTHKAFHVGHLRGTFLGASLIELSKFCGHETIAANYQGDIGAHVAKVIWYLQKYGPKYPTKHKGRWLGKIYQKANALAENNKEEISVVLQKIEAGDEALVKLWRETRQWSLDDFEEFYKLIGVHFDHYFFESDYEKPGKGIVKELLEKGIAEMSEGAVIIDLDNLGKFLLLKSDGTALYSTKDLSLAKDKFEKYNIDQSVYVVGAEQKLYFQQIFETVKRMGFEQAGKCRHIPYGLVNLKGGKISSREGELIYAEELVEEVISLAADAIKERHDISEDEIFERAKPIALGAIKFSFLSQDNNKEIVFDKEKSLSFEGETGPYIQYTYARIASILRKAGSYSQGKAAVTEPEHQLIRMLARYPLVIEDAHRQYRPNIICRYLLDLCQLFNHYYHETPIIKADEKDFRLHLVSRVQVVLKSGLSLLGIGVLEEM